MSHGQVSDIGRLQVRQQSASPAKPSEVHS